MTSKRCALLLSAALAALASASASSVGCAQQPVTIAGRITGENGNPVATATVAAPALGIGANANADGRYSLTVPADRARGGPVSLSIRAIGFKPLTAEVPLGEGDLVRDFVLAPNPLRLGELVVTGAGTQSEVEKLGSVRNNVDSTQLARSNEASLVNALAAKAPNVEVVSASGDPGASAAIRIRGVNTLSGDGQPLFVVDGQPIDNSVTTTAALDPQTGGQQGGVSSPNRVSDLNPADIESIEFLKGAAAGAVYGARAGQGVVLITTKRGRAGATQYSLRSNFQWSRINRVPALQQRFGQGDGGLSDPCADAARSDAPSFDCEATENTWGPELAAGTQTFDHAGEVYKTGFGTDNTLTMSGGNERTTFFFSGSLLDQGGVVFGPNNDFNRKAFRLKGDHRVFDNLKIGGNVSYTNSRQLAVQKGFNFSGVTWGAWRTPPEFNNLPFTTSTADSVQRSFRFPSPSFGNDNDTRGYDNPFWSAENGLSSSIVGRTVGNVTIDFTPAAWLTLSYTLGVDDGQDSRLQGQPPSTSNTPDPRGQVIKQTLVNTQWDHNLIANATYKLGGVRGTVSVGQNLNSRSFRQQGQVGNGMIADRPFTLNNTSSFPPPLDRESKVRVAGYFAQVTADLGDQLFLKGGIRRDGASTFAPDSRWAWFPSASAAWQFTKATGDFGGLLSYGKLRAAYGEVGTQPSPYLGAQVYQAGTFNDFDAFGVFSGQNGVGGLFTPELKPATQLKPERTREFEAGFDIGFLKDAGDLSFTWYRRSSVDVILQVPVAASSGYQLEGANAAKIRNSGTEWMLNLRPITRRNFGWDLSMTFSTNRNVVQDLRGAEFVPFGGLGGGIQGGAQSVAQVGQQIGIFRDYDYVRCGNGVVLTHTTDGSAYDVDANCSADQIAQHALFIDDGTFVNESGAGSAGAGFPLLDPTQRIVGDPNPRWLAGLRTGVRIGSFSVSGLLDLRHGGVLWNGTRAALNAVGTSKETERRGESVVFGTDFFPGPVAGPGAGTAATLDQNFFTNYDGWSFSSTIGTPFYESASFVRLREISVGYNLRNAFVTRTLGFSNVELRLAGRNLAVWTDYSGVDPETNLGGSETAARGIDFFNNPQTRTFVLSVTLNR
ncbi:MAG TPA: SusC/RagA family TonB-linked outer membrane protein [Gemmatimonadales bacterium]|nr:SusC/RagA family TonB-linked outer membrane protein [Gemmatimonadales bacterium]